MEPASGPSRWGACRQSSGKVLERVLSVRGVIYILPCGESFVHKHLWINTRTCCKPKYNVTQFVQPPGSAISCNLAFYHPPGQNLTWNFLPSDFNVDRSYSSCDLAVYYPPHAKPNSELPSASDFNVGRSSLNLRAAGSRNIEIGGGEFQVRFCTGVVG